MVRLFFSRRVFNPVTRGNALVIVNSIFISLAVTTVALRMYTRIIIRKWFGIDDVFILLALIFTLALTVIVLLASQSYGLSRHIYDIPLNQYAPTLKIAMAAKLAFISATTFTRLSLLCFYYRLIHDSGNKWFTWIVHVNVAYNVAMFIAFIFVAIFQCRPISNYWTFSAPADACMNEGVATLAVGIINCVADFITTITPIPLVMRLNLPARQRIAVGLLFSLGSIVTIAGIVRTYFIHVSFFMTYDQTWYSYPLWIAGAVEIDLGVICASAPVLKPLLAKITINIQETISRVTSITKKSHSSISRGATNNTPRGFNRLPGNSSAFSMRRFEGLESVPELTGDRGKSYELKHWSDVEHGLMKDTVRGSQEVIPEEDENRNRSQDRNNSQDRNSSQEGKGSSSKGFWKKFATRNGSMSSQENMTITLTSEVELRSDPLGVRSSRQMSNYPLPGSSSLGAGHDGFLRQPHSR